MLSSFLKILQILLLTDIQLLFEKLAYWPDFASIIKKKKHKKKR